MRPAETSGAHRRSRRRRDPDGAISLKAKLLQIPCPPPAQLAQTERPFSGRFARAPVQDPSAPSAAKDPVRWPHDQGRRKHCPVRLGSERRSQTASMARTVTAFAQPTRRKRIAPVRVRVARAHRVTKQFQEEAGFRNQSTIATEKRAKIKVPFPESIQRSDRLRSNRPRDIAPKRDMPAPRATCSLAYPEGRPREQKGTVRNETRSREHAGSEPRPNPTGSDTALAPGREGNALHSRQGRVPSTLRRPFRFREELFGLTDGQHCRGGVVVGHGNVN